MFDSLVPMNPSNRSAQALAASNAVCKRRTAMKFSLIAAVLPAPKDSVGPEFTAPTDRLAA
jgi:hypothetical protein